MKKHLMTLLFVLMLAIPLGFSFDVSIDLLHRGEAVALSIVAVFVLYLLIEGLASKKADWIFSEAYNGSLQLFGLPFNRLIFFVAWPYLGIFAYLKIVSWFPSNQLFPVGPSSLYAGTLVFILASWMFRKHGYTLLTMILTAIFLSTLGLSRPWLAGTFEFLVWFGSVFVLILIVSGVQSALPAVRHNPQAVLGLKIGTIPIEDLFYHLSIQGLSLCFFLSLLNILHLS